MSAIYKTKYWLRLTGISAVSKMWYMLGGSSNVARRFPRIGSEALIGQIAAMPPSKPRVAREPLRIAFLTMLGSHSYMVATDIALARALRARGHKVMVVLCDGILPLCQNKSINNVGHWEDACYKCWRHGRAQVMASGVDWMPASRAVADAQDEGAMRTLRAMDFKHTIGSALHKHFRVGRLTGDAAEFEAAQKFAQSCDLSARVALGVARWRPDRVVMSHGVYSTWAPAVQAFNDLGIPVAAYNKGKRWNTTVMNWVQGFMDWDVSDEWRQVKEVPLTQKQEERIRAYLVSRRNHSKDALRYNFGEEESVEETRARLGLDASKPTFVAFTNLLWDAASAQKDIVFANAVDWVLETIEWFAAHPGKQLVVKIHPAEVIAGTKQPFAQEIRSRFPVLPTNVRVIEPTERVNSWSIMRIATAGIVHTSTPGMEMPLEGIPCIVVSQAHFRGKGFTCDVSSKEEYFSLIEHWNGCTIDSEALKTYSLRYAYLLFQRYHLDWSFLHESLYGLYTAYNFDSDKTLLLHPTVNVVCRAVEEKKAFVGESDE